MPRVASRLPLAVFLTGPDTDAIVRALAPVLPDRSPDSVRADYAEAARGPWLDAVAGARELASAEWENASLGVIGGRGVSLEVRRASSRAAALELLAGVPWQVASLPSYAETWMAEHAYRPPGFDGGHGPHGWACAFRDAGHERLVSRRWLPVGPWALTRVEDEDISFVQFHDPRAMPDAALAEARPGHRRMGVTDEGGFLQEAPVLADGLPGLYERDTKTHKVVVHGRDVRQREMLGACQIRWQRRDDPEAPIARVAYVFMEPARAEAHLRDLWLRELECWTIVDGAERRLDGDAPPPAS